MEDSPNLFSVDETNDGTVHLQPTTRSSGRKPAKILDVTIPLRTPTFCAYLISLSLNSTKVRNFYEFSSELYMSIVC